MFGDNPPGFLDFIDIGRGREFPNPFRDMASASMPTQFRTALHWCQYVFSVFGTYRMAIERTIAYFITSLKIENASDDEAEKWEKFLNDTLDILSVCQAVLRDRFCYGNAFASIIAPFQRWLTCPRCGLSVPFREVYENTSTFSFEWKLPHFIATCPQCKTGRGYRGPWQVDDRDDNFERSLRVKQWSPHEIEIVHDLYSGKSNYFWRIPEVYKQQIRRGLRLHLENAPMEILEAVANDSLFRFYDDAIFHMKEPTLAGFVNLGWGIPRMLYHFRQIWHVQVLKRQNEAIALGYVVPWQIIAPAPMRSTGMGGEIGFDPLTMTSGHTFVSAVESMIRRRRRDPLAVMVLPYPVQYQLLGGEAKQLAPHDLMALAHEQLLNEAGVPVELYQGTLQAQPAPVALRLYESTFRDVVNDANRFLQWVTSRAAMLLSWENVDVSLKRVTLADDLERQMLAAQLMMSGKISDSAVLDSLGLSFREEELRKVEEAQYRARVAARAQREMDQAALAQELAKAQQQPPPPPGQPAPAGPAPAPPAGAPMPPDMVGGAGPVSRYLATMGANTHQRPEDILALAHQLADELLGIPESLRVAELRLLRQSNELMHKLVLGILQQKRRDIRSQAGNVAVAQMEQGGAMPPG